jgi:RNA polymerase sigma factor (sigma-70 family)
MRYPIASPLELEVVVVVKGVKSANEFSWPTNELVEAAQLGDEASLEALLLGSHPHVVRFARSLCSTPEDAEEAAQEALIVLFRHVGTLRVTAALSSWLFQIVKNECVRRSRAVVRTISTHRDLQIASCAIEASAEQVAIGRLEAQRVAAALMDLPPSYRQVLVMRDIQSLSGSEVAARLGLSKSAMKSTLHRARMMLRETLERSNPCD